jgi:hypothetical protein
MTLTNRYVHTAIKQRVMKYKPAWHANSVKTEIEDEKDIMDCTVREQVKITMNSNVFMLYLVFELS